MNNMFIGHKLIESKKECTLILYLEPQLAEFALDFLKKNETNKDKKSVSLEKSISEYISEAHR